MKWFRGNPGRAAVLAGSLFLPATQALDELPLPRCEFPSLQGLSGDLGVEPTAEIPQKDRRGRESLGGQEQGDLREEKG